MTNQSIIPDVIAEDERDRKRRASKGLVRSVLRISHKTHTAARDVAELVRRSGQPRERPPSIGPTPDVLSRRITPHPPARSQTERDWLGMVTQRRGELQEAERLERELPQIASRMGEAPPSPGRFAGRVGAALTTPLLPESAREAISEKANIPLPGGREIPTGPPLARAAEAVSTPAVAAMFPAIPAPMAASVGLEAIAGAAAEDRVPGWAQPIVETGAGLAGFGLPGAVRRVPGAVRALPPVITEKAIYAAKPGIPPVRRIPRMAGAAEGVAREGEQWVAGTFRGKPVAGRVVDARGRVFKIETPTGQRVNVRRGGLVGIEGPEGASEFLRRAGAGETPKALLGELETALSRTTRAVRGSPRVTEAVAEQRAAQLRGKVGAAAAVQVSGRYGAEEAIKVSMAQLKGPAKAAQYMPINLFPADRTAMFERIVTSPKLSVLDRINAGGALIDRLDNGVGITPYNAGLLRRVFGKDFGEVLTREGAPGLLGKAGRFAISLWNVPRGIKASLDASATLRQGVVPLVARPRHAPRMLGAQIKGYTAHPEKARAWNEALTLDADVQLLQGQRLKTKLELTGWTGGLAEREEMFMTDFAELIPGIGRSQRAYTMGLNQLRVDMAKSLLRRARAEGTPLTDKLLSDINWYVNVASGRGQIGNMGAFAPYLNAGFWSVRYSASRFQLLAAPFKTSGIVRRMVIEDLVKFVSTGVGVLGMLKYSGLAEVELNPRSTDWGKGKIGPMRFDFWGGEQQIARTVAQIVTGDRKTIAEDIYGENKIQGIDRFTAAQRFLQGKLSPSARMLWDLVMGNQADMFGEKMRFGDPGWWGTESWEFLAPMVWEDIREAYEKDSLESSMAAGVMSFFGLNVQVYKSPYTQYVRAVDEARIVEGWTQEDLWSDSTKLDEIKAKYPDVRAAVEAMRKDAALHNRNEQQRFYDYAEETHTRIKTQMGEFDDLYNSGQMPGYSYRRQASDLDAAHFRLIKGAQEGFGIEYPEREYPDESVNAAVDEYFAVEAEDFPDANGNTDWRAFRAAREATLEGLTPEERTRFDKYLHDTYWTETRLRVEQRMDEAEVYFEQVDKVWDWLRENPTMAIGLPVDFANFSSYGEWRTYTVQAMTLDLMEAAGYDYRLADNLAKRRVAKMAKSYLSLRGTIRKRFLVGNPEIGDILSEFYGDTISAEILEEQYGGLPAEMQTKRRGRATPGGTRLPRR